MRIGCVHMGLLFECARVLGGAREYAVVLQLGVYLDVLMTYVCLQGYRYIAFELIPYSDTLQSNLLKLPCRGELIS